MNQKITIISTLILSLLLCFTLYSAHGLYMGQPEEQQADTKKYKPPVDLSNLKQLQPFSLKDDILTAHYVLPSNNNLMSTPRYCAARLIMTESSRIIG